MGTQVVNRQLVQIVLRHKDDALLHSSNVNLKRVPRARTLERPDKDADDFVWAPVPHMTDLPHLPRDTAETIEATMLEFGLTHLASPVITTDHHHRRDRQHEQIDHDGDYPTLNNR